MCSSYFPLTFFKHSLCAMSQVKCLTDIISLSSPNTSINWGSQRWRLAQGYTNKKWSQGSTPNLFPFRVHVSWPICSIRLFGFRIFLRVVIYEPGSKCPPNFMTISSEVQTYISLEGGSNLREEEGRPFSLLFFIFEVHAQVWGKR